MRTLVLFLEMNYAFREWNGTEGKRGGERANLARRGREREREKFPPDAAAKKQKLLPKIAGSMERREGRTAIKEDQKFCASFSECSCVKVGGASKSGNFIYLSPVNSIGQRRSHTRFSKRKKESSHKLQRSSKHLGPSEKKKVGHLLTPLKVLHVLPSETDSWIV